MFLDYVINPNHYLAEKLELAVNGYGGGGTVRDASLFRRHGSMVNMENADWSQRSGRWSLDFGGVDEEVQFRVPFSNANFTVAAWIKNVSGGTQRGIWLGDYRGFTYLSVFAGESVASRVGAYIGDGAAFDNCYSQGTGFTAGNWHHLCITRSEGATPIIYIDGDSKAVSGASTKTVDCECDVSPVFYRPLEGSVSQLMVWSRPLSAGDVRVVAFDQIRMGGLWEPEEGDDFEDMMAATATASSTNPMDNVLMIPAES